MMNYKISAKIAVAFFMMALVIIGCDSKTDEGKTFSEAAPEDVTMSEDDHGHDHPSEGPHHGALIELGKEAYHAELVHDEKNGSVIIYLLDSAVKKSVPINAESVLINIKSDGKGQQFTLHAKPDENDPQGQSSRFTIEDKAIGELLDKHDVDARLVLEIDGKSFNGKVPAHDHDHDHKHAH